MADELAGIALTLVTPYQPFQSVSGFVPLPAPLKLAMSGPTVAYVVAAELAKECFYARLGQVNHGG